jgi:sec-independent protein translocase protein TatA
VFGLGTQELMLILLIVVLLFGATKLPQIGSGIGQAIRNFKKSVSEADADEEEIKKKVALKESE